MQVIDTAFASNRPIGCFISEIVISSEGMVVPPHGYFQELYKYINELEFCLIIFTPFF